MSIREIMEYLHDADPGVLRVLFGVVLFYCLIGVPLTILHRKTRR